MADKPLKEILPTAGIWTIQDLADYLEIDPNILQQQLSEYGVKTMSFSNRFKHRLIRLEDIAGKICTGKHGVIESSVRAGAGSR